MSSNQEDCGHDAKVVWATDGRAQCRECGAARPKFDKWHVVPLGRPEKYAKNLAERWNTDYGRAEYWAVGARWHLELATGGWSENEALIESMDAVFHACFWQSSHRGGLHMFGTNDRSVSQMFGQAADAVRSAKLDVEGFTRATDAATQITQLPICAAKGCSILADPRFYIHSKDRQRALMACDGHGNPGCPGNPCSCPEVKNGVPPGIV